MKKLLASVGILSLMSLEAQALKLYLVSNHDNAGDHNQVLGVEKAIENVSL